MDAQPPVVLVFNDEQMVLDMLSRFARQLGFEVVACRSGHEAIARLGEHKADVALVDLHMPDVGGLDVLGVVRGTHPRCQTILMTGYASIDSAVEAVKLGAMDYLSKPIDLRRLQQLLVSARDDLARRRELLAMDAEVARRLEFHGMVGRSPAMQQLFATIRRIAPHLRTALVTGETGTGKKLVARALHAAGTRQARPLTVIDCSAVHHASFEVELFGAAPGAYPGAEGRPGLFEAADGGVVFLDEVAELSLAVQARLLRVIEFGEVHRVGSLDVRRVDVQVIAGTRRALETEVAAGRFRSDLYSRLTSVEFLLPPLRDRREDIPYLVAHVLRDCAARLGKPIRGVTTAAEALLVSAPWEGNVRELRSVIERACLITDDEFVTEREVAPGLPALTRRAPAPEPDGDDHRLSTVEREHILRALQRAGGNKKAAARMLGVSRRALYRRLERLDLGATITRRRMLGAALGG
jgi:two-component system, NtrC family, response regulator HydG